eukprot:TRINITY_DN33637_c0_g1_i1.p1 TRINITY_DN33637_c0_g1~~TRINITY_DN33637_c0_g1_i1.p1  ORF type:complete len:1120 (+),score=203.98 TRINITY_DN33637_c0_g1_i1:50-3361(+)
MKERASVFTQLILVPNVASTEHPVKVKWLVGADVKWQPNGNDEIRVFNTAGVLLSCEQMWNCTPHPTDGYVEGEGVIIAPATEGSYVVCLYDYALKRRVFSSTFRVAGSKVGLPQEIDVKQAETPPCGRIDIAFNPKSLHGGYLALFRASDPDNGGMNVDCSSPFGCSLLTISSPTPDLLVSFDSTSLAFVAPEKTGNYQIRYLKTSRTGILRSTALSNTFTVRGETDSESLFSQSVKGVIELPGAPQAGVMVGDTITASWDITEGLPVLSELDCIFLYPYGRPEAVRQTDEVHTTTTAKLAKWRAELEAPYEAGRYEVGYFSHRLQKFILDGPSVLVVGEYAQLTVDVKDIRTEVGTPTRFHWILDELVYRPEDRCRIYDEGMSLYGSIPIKGFTNYCNEEDESRKVLFARRSQGTMKVEIERPGKYIAVYWSSLLNREIAKTESFRALTTGTYPAKDRQVSLSVRLRQSSVRPIQILYSVQGSTKSDTKDFIGIYKAGDPDWKAARFFDSIDAIPAKRIFWLNNHRNGSITMQPIPECGDYEVRYLTPTGHGCWSSIVKYRFKIITVEEDNSGIDLSSERLEQLPLRELATAETCLSDNDGEGRLENCDLGPDFSKRKRDFVPPSTNTKQRGSHVSLHVNLNTEFKGSIVPPKNMSLTKELIVTYHLLEGYPNLDDHIVLLNELCTEVQSEAPISSGVGKPDLSLGTVILAPPRSRGLYVLSYYSSKHRSLVINSPLIRISGDDESNDQELTETSSSSLNWVVSQRVTGRFKALLIGAACHGGDYNLRGTSNDCLIMSRMLQSHFKVDSTNIRILNELGNPSSQPTTFNIRSGIQWLLEDSQPRDHLLFYFSGLGSRINNYTSEETSGYDCCLLPIDYDWRQRCIRFSELKESLYLAAPRGCEVTVILDCCHAVNTLDLAVQRGVFHEDEVSGTATHLGAIRLRQLRTKQGWDDRVVSRFLAPPQGTFHSHCECKSREQRNLTNWKENLGGLSDLLHQVDADAEFKPTDRRGMWLIQASRDKELAAEKFIEGKYYGLFTWSFIKAIEALKDKTSPANPMWYSAIMHEVQSALSKWPYRQTPRLCVACRDDVYESLFHLPDE